MAEFDPFARQNAFRVGVDRIAQEGRARQGSLQGAQLKAVLQDLAAKDATALETLKSLGTLQNTLVGKNIDPAFAGDPKALTGALSGLADIEAFKDITGAEADANRAGLLRNIAPGQPFNVEDLLAITRLSGPGSAVAAAKASEEAGAEAGVQETGFVDPTGRPVGTISKRVTTEKQTRKQKGAPGTVPPQSVSPVSSVSQEPVIDDATRLRQEQLVKSIDPNAQLTPNVTPDGDPIWLVNGQPMAVRRKSGTK